MTRFASPEALVSWAGLTPAARQSGPRKGRGKKGHGNTYAKRIAVLAAYAAANTDTFLGERFRRLASRPGGGRKKAGCAVGRSILIIVWHLLNDPAARYRDLGPRWHARHTDRSRKARNARRQLEALGYDVIITLREDAARPRDHDPPRGHLAICQKIGHVRRLRWSFLGQSRCRWLPAVVQVVGADFLARHVAGQSQVSRRYIEDKS
jgi:Transposase IS116/IS110/IS902 family